mmetsp:Transcript_5116/g.10545  ORF Transcript_5116/g.10545 Transcript_5116/m.10545 type:complete len:256 (+) Transcript_5116:2675-3442(+)
MVFRGSRLRNVHGSTPPLQHHAASKRRNNTANERRAAATTARHGFRAGPGESTNTTRVLGRYGCSVFCWLSLFRASRPGVPPWVGSASRKPRTNEATQALPKPRPGCVALRIESNRIDPPTTNCSLCRRHRLAPPPAGTAVCACAGTIGIAERKTDRSGTRCRGGGAERRMDDGSSCDFVWIDEKLRTDTLPKFRANTHDDGSREENAPTIPCVDVLVLRPNGLFRGRGGIDFFREFWFWWFVSRTRHVSLPLSL